MKAPFPWFGGKRRVAPEVWRRFGDVAVYAEPFAGSLAVLLGRPSEHAAHVETVNDLDGFVCNAWRAILHDPDSTAHHADWPSNENDLHARHAWLVERRELLPRRLEGDPEWYDAKIAGWWLWGIACWIGGEFCSGHGSWVRTEVAPGDWQLLKGDAGRGVQRQRVHLNAGRGNAADGEQGLLEWLRALSQRLAGVRVCCGDWRRILTPSALAPGVGGARGVFLDPPYSTEACRDDHTYACDSGTVAHDVRRWCLAAPADYRIALCGYEGEGHEELEAAGWSTFAWCAHGGMSTERGVGSGGNNERERIWFSPACLGAEAPAAQLGLFEGVDEGA